MLLFALSTMATSEQISKYLDFCETKNILKIPKVLEIMQCFGFENISFEKYDFLLILYFPDT